MSFVFILGMFALGCAVGLVNAGLGIGGGILMVPALREFVPGMDAHTAKGTSLFIIIFVAGMNAWRQNRGQPIPWRTACGLATGSILGGYLGVWVTAHLSGPAVTWIFVALVGVAALRLMLSTPRPRAEAHGWQRDGFALGIGLITGLASGMTGIGGGLVLVSLALLSGLSTNERVTALSNLVMVGTCLASATAHLMGERMLAMPGTVGQVALALAPAIFIGAQVGSPFGRVLNTRLTLRQRKTTLAVLLAIIAVRMTWRALM